MTWHTIFDHVAVNTGVPIFFQDPDSVFLGVSRSESLVNVGEDVEKLECCPLMVKV
jgi:hypothetical protein